MHFLNQRKAQLRPDAVKRARRHRVGLKLQALALFLAFTTPVFGIPTWARADELNQRLLQELERRDKVIRTLAARVKVLEETIVGLQRAAAVKPVTPRRQRQVASNRPPASGLTLSDAELDRIVAGSLPKQFSGTGAAGSSLSLAGGLPVRGASGIQVSQATAPQTAPAATAPATPPASTAGSGEPPAIADASGEPEERNVLRVPLANVTRGGNLLRPGQFQIEPSFGYTYSENTRLIVTGFSVIPLVILGTLESEQVERNSVASALSFRYGLIRDLQFDFRLPFIYSDRSRVRLSNEDVSLVRETESDFGVGDLAFGLTYQPIYESGWIPDVTVSARVRAPTGRSQFDIFKDISQGGSFDSVEEFVRRLDDQGISTGSGFWGLTLGASFVKSADPAVLFGSVGYTFNFAKNVTTIGIAQDPRGDAVAIVPTTQNQHFNPGDSVQFSLGIALALNSQMSVNLGFSDLIGFEGATDGVQLTGTDVHAATFNTGFTMAIRPRLSVDVTAGFGLTPDAPDFSLGMSLPVTFNSVQDLIPSSWRSG